MADSVAAATPALDCSYNNSFYEPLVGLRLGALFGILAVSSIGGNCSFGHLRFSSGLARAMPEELLFRPMCLFVYAEKCLTSFCVACSVPASFHLHSKAQQSVLFSQGVRSWRCPGDRLCTCARRCYTTAQ